MPIDFEKSFGVNAGYVESLFDEWSADPNAIDASWGAYFERIAPRAQPAAPAPAAAAPAEPAATADPDVDVEPLRGMARNIAANMDLSLALPTATTVRTLPVKALVENRRLLNGHMSVRALGKASFTHLVAFALVRALSEDLAMQASYHERDGKGERHTSKYVNLGLAIDVAMPGGRALLVPNIKRACQLDFRGFLAAYDDLVKRGRDGKLGADDFKGTTCTLTNPGGFGTQMSVPRLMQGQGVIVATGSIGVPAEAASMSPETLAGMALGPVMTVTSTYDHRVIQGAQSALLLKRIEELLNGADGFYADVFRELRVPWVPAVPTPDAKRRSRIEDGEAQARVWALINAYRVRGCQLADLDPLAYRPDPLPSLDPASYGFTIWDLDREFLVGDLAGEARLTLREALDVLRESYCRRWTIEYMHVVDRTRKHWLRDRIEARRNEQVFDDEDRRSILGRLYHAQNFEQFLHKRYVGNKRFSLEGAEALIPALAELIERAGAAGVEKVVIGMAHRGRLNVLTNILGKSYAQVFREFEGVLLPLSTEGSGDVKYHLGQRGRFKTRAGHEIEVVLAANPSHLEAVDPAVGGLVRGYQDELADADRKRVLGVLVHGDAAFAGQGVVAETLQMSNLPAFRTGGTVHIVVNNQIGFTAGPKDTRSTYYCTDIAKSIQAPILHANGDNPEAVLRSVHVAVDYQREFGLDVVVDLVCYRRWGHNEGDEPAFTQPALYRRIRRHPTVVDHYRDLLVRQKSMTPEACDEVGAEVDLELKSAVEELGDSQVAQGGELPLEEVIDVRDDDPADFCTALAPETGVPTDKLEELVVRLNTLPEGHVAHPNLVRQLSRRERMVRGEQGVDWGCAEALAFATIVCDGTPIRLVGQDSGRGTFSHRHSVIRHQESGIDYVPLDDLGDEAASFEVRDSLLSEEAALVYEWGYSLARPSALVLWEAQFGDFVNGAQIGIDQFIVASEVKWKEKSGLVMLLPHGFDGQGPEHSSARFERFLTLCSHGNISVTNCTNSAQYFHLLRRHVSTSPRRPLVVLTPKSLLRDHRAASSVEALSAGSFHELLPDTSSDLGEVRRVILCSGKVYYDLEAYREEQGRNDVALLRLEQIYPLPLDALRAELERFPGADLVWAQEEPKNMGAWTFLAQRLHEQGIEITYAGRARSASPATGSYKRHAAEQDHLVRRAFGAS